MRIFNGVLYTMEGEPIENGFVDFEGGKITACGAYEEAPAYEGECLDAKGGYIMPGFIDAHTHIGISEEGVRWEGEDCNEMTNPVTPSMRAMDGFYPLDTAIKKSVAAGVTCAVVAPGSANVIGGQIAAIKLHGSCVDDMILKAPCAMKFATGENPKRFYGENKGKAPMTRMATSAIMRDTLTKAQRYLAKKEAGEDVYDADMEALIPVLKCEIPVHFHAHRSDDILSAMRVAREFGLKYTIVHATKSFDIVPYIKEAGIIPIVGPSSGPSGKPETMGGSFKTAGILNNEGVEIAITTDHDVTPLWLLPMFAAMDVREGLDEAAALRGITINSAKVVGIEDRVGSIKVGKDADIAVFNGHPFHWLTKTGAVFIDGERVF